MRPDRNVCRLTREDGVLIPLIGIIGLAVTVVLLILGVETSRTKAASTELRQRVDTLCALAAQTLPVQRQAAKLFMDGINDLWGKIPHTTLTKMRLVLPTAVDRDLVTPPPDPAEACTPPGQSPPWPPGGGSGTNDFFPLIGNDCRSEMESCLLEWRICSPLPYPPRMWAPEQSAGNVIGCEVEAVVAPVLGLSSPRPIQAKVAWAIPVVAPQPVPYDGSNIATLKGLSIGIAPQVTTWLEADTGGGLPDRRFRLDVVSSQLLGLAPLNPLNKGGFGLENPLYRRQASPVMNVSGSDKQLPSDQRELEIGCVNMLSIVRNMLVSTIVELAARHGELRTMTEILVLNPKNYGSSALRSPPARIVALSQDLTRRLFELPYIVYNSGTTTTAPPHKDGWVLPTIPGVNSSPRKKHLALIANQLRACVHLFRGNSAAAGGINRIPTLNLSGMNAKFEDSNPRERPSAARRFSFVESLRSDDTSPFPANPRDSWDSQIDSNASPPPPHRLLTAAEVVGSLGSVQACPTQDVPGGLAPCPDPSARLSFASSDLAPDYESFLAYLAAGGLDSPALNEPTRCAAPAYLPPGLRNAPEPGGGEALPFGTCTETAPSYALAPATPTSVLLIGHRPPASDAEAVAIRSQVDVLNSEGRYLTFVYLPARAEDEEPDDLLRICRAFGIRGTTLSDMSCTADEPDDTPFNELMYLGPRNPDYDDVIEYADALIPQQHREAGIYLNYWLDLLTAGFTSATGANTPGTIFVPYDNMPDEYIITKAQGLFSRRLVRIGRRL